MKKRLNAAFINRLNALTELHGNSHKRHIFKPQDAHRKADEVLLEALESSENKEVADKYRQIRNEMGFEYGKA